VSYVCASRRSIRCRVLGVEGGCRACLFALRTRCATDQASRSPQRSLARPPALSGPCTAGLFLGCDALSNVARSSCHGDGQITAMAWGVPPCSRRGNRSEARQLIHRLPHIRWRSEYGTTDLRRLIAWPLGKKIRVLWAKPGLGGEKRRGHDAGSQDIASCATLGGVEVSTPLPYVPSNRRDRDPGGLADGGRASYPLAVPRKDNHVRLVRGILRPLPFARDAETVSCDRGWTIRGAYDIPEPGSSGVGACLRLGSTTQQMHRLHQG